mgnify:CR=1 FL=1
MKKMGPPKKDPSTVDPLYLKYKLRGYSYYWQNQEKVKQKVKDKRLLANQHRPPLNLICVYCDKALLYQEYKKMDVNEV